MKTAQTRKRILSTAMALFNSGLSPSLTEIAEHAGVSRATAYRYFPTQTDLIDALVKESLQAALNWEPKEINIHDRINALFDFSFPTMLENEGALRAALKTSLEEWATIQIAPPIQLPRRAERLIRGNRKYILNIATEPLHTELTGEQLLLLKQSLSLIFGSECFLVFKDIWGLANDDILKITKWMAKAIINQIEREKQLTEKKKEHGHPKHHALPKSNKNKTEEL